MEEISGYIITTLYSNSSNGYTIAKLKLDQKENESITIVGYFQVEHKEQLVKYKGEYVDHPKFGRQFKVLSYEKVMPNSEDGVIKFLSSSLFPGCGRTLAKRIVDTLGSDCIDKINLNNDILNTVPKIKEKQVKTILKVLKETDNVNNAIKIFIGYGIDLKYILKMQAIYKENLLTVVNNNPYQIIKDIDGISFNIADKLAYNMGVPFNDKRRVEAYIVYILKYLCFKSQGTYLSKEILFKYVKKEIYDLEYLTFEEYLQDLFVSLDIVLDKERVYPYILYESEEGIVAYIHKYLNSKNNISLSIINKNIKLAEEEIGITYSEDQREAIRQCFLNNIMILNGGPGTGKTTVINGIINIYNRMFKNKIIKMCAPTGRASKRLSEVSEKEAVTIHRLLKYDLETNIFLVDDLDPIYGDFLIVDEFSMVDCYLFYSLLRGVHPFNKILLVGDSHQLPPVSPGDCLTSLLKSGKIKNVELTTIHRQDDNSTIIPLCYDVRNGIYNEYNLNSNDVNFIECDQYHVKDVLEEILRTENPTLDEHQVLSAKYEGVGGIYDINDYLQNYFNPKTSLNSEVNHGRFIFRENDKVMQLKNRVDDNIYNGDIGYIERIHKDEVYVHYDDDNIVKYKREDYIELTNAYCVSIHKSQGSEYNIVIVIMLNSFGNMLRRKLLYTALSRAKQRLYIVGQRSAYIKALNTLDEEIKNTSLLEKMMEI